MDQIIAIQQCGRNAARARRNNDEAGAKFETDYALKMIRLEEDPRQGHIAFEKAYKDFNEEYR